MSDNTDNLDCEREPITIPKNDEYYARVINYLDVNFKKRLTDEYMEKFKKFGPGLLNLEIHDIKSNNFKHGFWNLENLLKVNQIMDGAFDNVMKKIESNNNCSYAYVSVMIDDRTFMLEYDYSDL